MLMRGIIILSLILVLIACSAESQGKVELKTKMDSISYAVGMQLGMNFKTDSVFLSEEALAAGFYAGQKLDSNKRMLSPAQQRLVLTEFTQIMQQKMMQKQMAESEGNKKANDAFFAANAKKEGVITLPSGLQYKVIKEGDGKKPTDTSEVTVHYKGTTIDGKVFDSSIDRGQPITFKLSGVIKGWQQGIPLMKEGGKYMLYIPGELAYGQNPPPNQVLIKPNQALIFEVELIKVVK